jgi:hypothetical protein
MSFSGPSGLERVGPRGRLALAVADAVDSTGVVRRSAGSGVEAVTLYPGGRVIGVRLGSQRVTVHVTVVRLPLAAAAAAVRDAAVRAVAAAGLAWEVFVVIDDLDVEQLPSRRVQ